MEGILFILGLIVALVFIPILLQYFIFSKKNMDDSPSPILEVLKTNHRIELIATGIMVIIVGLFMLFLK